MPADQEYLFGEFPLNLALDFVLKFRGFDFCVFVRFPSWTGKSGNCPRIDSRSDGYFTVQGRTIFRKYFPTDVTATAGRPSDIGHWGQVF